jgi:Ca2+-binding EF-hand superfamily protein
MSRGMAPSSANVELLLPLAALLFAWSGQASQAAEDARLESARSAFAILDMDGDQKVTFREFAYRKMDAFSAPDRDGDGDLTAEEVLITPQQFKEVDRDGDGHIMLLEFIDSRYGQFEIYDADSNGTVDLPEFTRNLSGG